MTDFGLRIGPKVTPAQEEKPVHNHKVWTRPGYQPPLRLVSPKKPRALRHSGDWSMDNRSSAVTEGDLSLLSRMGLDIPSSSSPRSGNVAFGDRCMSGQRFSARNGGDTAEEQGTRTITLGNHHLGLPSLHDNDNARRDSLISDCLSDGESLENERLSSPSSGSGGYSSRDSRVTGAGSPRRCTSDAQCLDSPTTIFPEVLNTTKRSTENPDPPWSQLPLRDRIAPLVRQNLQLRFSQNRFAPNSCQDEQHLDNESLDAVLTPEVCNSIADSLNATRSQLAEKNAAKLSQQNTVSASRGHDKGQCIQPQAEPPTSFLQSTNMQTPMLKPNPPTPQTPVPKAPSTHEQPTNTNQRQAPSSTTTSLSSVTTSQQFFSAGSAAPPVDAQREAIPIPLNTAFFNHTPALSTPPNAVSSSSTTFHMSIKRGSNMIDDLEPSHRQPPSPNPRPHKRFRSRSPSLQYLRGKDGIHKGDAPDSSSARRDSLPSLSISSSRRRRGWGSPWGSRSPPTQSRSPTRWDPDSHRRNSVHRWNASPSRPCNPRTSRDHSSRHLAKEPSELRLPRTSQTSSYKTTREPYLTAYEREQRAQEAGKNDERERRASAQRQSVAALNINEECRQSSASAGESTGDGQTNLPRTPGDSTRQSPALLMPSAPVASSADRSTILQQTLLKNSGLDETSKLASEGVHIAAREKEASADADLNLAATPVDADVQADAGIEGAKDHTWKPFSDIPGIWLFRQGSSEPDVLEETFEVTKEIVQRWQSKPLQVNMVQEKPVPASTSFAEVLFEPKLALSPTIPWNLICVATESMHSLRDNLNKSATAKELLQELFRIQSRWPTNGQLIIEINPDHDIGGTLYANNLDSAIPCMEVKGHIHTTGSNVVRLIQLGDMSKYVFILFATPVSEPAHSHDDVSLENLQMMLQKSRISKGLASMTGSVIIQKL